MKRHYLIRVGDAFSQLVNTVILNGEPNESISGRCWRLRHKPVWKQARIVIDFIFSPFEKDHCQASYLADFDRAAELVHGGADKDAV